MNQFRSSNSRIRCANFSDMPITDETLESFLEEHSKTITHLDVSNCSHLTPLALKHINTIMTRLSDAKKMIRTVRVIEEGPVQESRVLFTKKYFNGIITTTTQNCSVAENVGLITDDYSLTQAMGVFDDHDFADFKSRKIRELNGIKSSDYDEPMSIDYSLALDTNSHNFCHDFSYDNNNKSLIIPNDVECIKSREVYSVNTSENIIKTLEINTWQNSPLQTLIIGRSTHILPDYIEEDGLDDDVSHSVIPFIKLLF